MHCTPSLQSKLQNKAGSVNSTTPTVICSVINKQHWSHKCGCQYIHYNSAPYTHHKLRRWSAVGNTTHTLPPHPLPHLAWRPSCFGQSKLEAGHAPMVRRGADGLGQNCVKCNKMRTDTCNSLGPPRQMSLTKPQCHNRANSCKHMHHATKRGFKDCPGFLNSTGRLGPKRGWKCYVTPAFSGVPNKGDKIRSQNLRQGSP